MPTPLELLRPELAEFKAYAPDSTAYRVRLDANEAPPLFPDQVRARLGQAFSAIAFERYPDATERELREAVAIRLGVAAEEVLLGVGSDELIAILLTALSRVRKANDPPTVLTTTPSFVMYRMTARLRGQRVVEVPLDANWELAEESLLRAIEMAPPHIAFIASPNNPTGTVAPPERLERLIQAAPGSLFVVDEAYVDYADRHLLELYRRHENVVVLRTLSKVGFAALRVGWLVGRKELVAELDKVRLPYNLSTPSQVLAKLVLREFWPEVTAVVELVKTERARLTAGLEERGFDVTPSQANFVWTKTPRPAGEVFDGLKARGVLVRSFHEKGGRLASQLRITIGTPAENDELLQALDELR
jgi:histidinol-phosphate aminotransferase